MGRGGKAARGRAGVGDDGIAVSDRSPEEQIMATVTGDDVRALARAENPHAVLAVVVLYTRADLAEDFGEEITDIDADVLAGGLSAQTEQ